MTDEELIEAAAHAARTELDWTVDEVGFIPTMEDVARVMLAAFREAQKPTDNEREALAAAFARVWVDHDVESGDIPGDYELADAAFAAGFHRTEQGEPERTEFQVFDADGEWWASADTIEDARHFLAQEPGGYIEKWTGRRIPVPDTEGSKK